MPKVKKYVVVDPLAIYRGAHAGETLYVCVEEEVEATPTQRVVKALADGYDHDYNDEMGDAWCRYCDAYKILAGGNVDHVDGCVVLLARKLVGPEDDQT